MSQNDKEEEPNSIHPDTIIEDIEIPTNGTGNQEMSSNVESHKIDPLKSNTYNEQTNGAEEPNKMHEHGVVEQIVDRNNWKIRKTTLKKPLFAAGIAVVCIFPHWLVAYRPTHDVMKHPEYWYEVIYLWCFGTEPLVCLNIIYICKNVMDIPEIGTAKVWLRLLLTEWVVTVAFYSIQYMVWTLHLGYHQPLPHNGAIFAFLSGTTLACSLWWQFPKGLREDPQVGQRIKAFAIYTFWLTYMVILTFVFGQMTIPLFPSAYLWLIGFEFWGIKEFNKFVMSKWIRKAAGPNGSYAKGALSLQLVTITNFTVVVFISTVADQKTTACFIAVDVVVNLMLTWKTIKASKRLVTMEPDFARQSGDSQDMSEQLLTTLIINESMELLAPLAYMAAFAVAYYGPNAKNLGNVGNSYWHFERIDDMWAYFIGALQMALADFLQSVTSFLLIWKLTKINVWEKYRDVAKKFGILAAIFVPYVVNAVTTFFIFIKLFNIILNSISLYFVIDIRKFVIFTVL